MKKWKKEPISVESVRRLNETFGVDYITASLLERRGVNESQKVKFFLENDTTYLHNPFLFDEMEMFVERVLEAQSEHQKVCIFGDRDVDGITSTVLLVQELEAMGIETTWRLPQGDEPYGLTRAYLDEAASQGVELVITVDCGISNIDEVLYAKELGIGVLITDHHLGGDIIPAADAVINPKLEGCDYPFGDLAGCGVVAKCIWALRFAKSDFYNEELLLFHAYPGNTEKGKETVIFEAIKVRNLLIEERVIEEISVGLVPLEQSRIIRFLDCNLPIFALDVEVQKELFKRAFGNSLEIYMSELRGQFETVLPQVKGKSIFALMRISRSLRYIQQATELDLLFSLFHAFVVRKYPPLSTGYEDILDLVALGTVGDLMPMVDENRIMVRIGMAKMGEGKRPELQLLLSLQKLSGVKLSTNDIGWQISPLINAAGRLGRPDVAANLFLAKDIGASNHYVEELFSLNRERQKQSDEAWERMERGAKQSLELYDQKFILVDDKKVNRGLTGIIASRLLRNHKVPALVLAYVDKEQIRGSMRSGDNFNTRDFLELFGELFSDYGGHRCAGGFNMPLENLPLFRERLEEYIKRYEGESNEEEEVVTIDVELPIDYLNPTLIDLVEAFEPYGEGNPPLQFLINKAKVESLQYLGQNGVHLKLQLRHGEYSWPALYWNGGEETDEIFSEGDFVDVVFKMGRNYFRNTETLQLTVVAIQKHFTPIESPSSL
jgi:single-stranded-DNA-specific exonuclease